MQTMLLTMLAGALVNSGLYLIMPLDPVEFVTKPEDERKEENGQLETIVRCRSACWLTPGAARVCKTSAVSQHPR